MFHKIFILCLLWLWRLVKVSGGAQHVMTNLIYVVSVELDPHHKPRTPISKTGIDTNTHLKYCIYNYISVCV